MTETKNSTLAAALLAYVTAGLQVRDAIPVEAGLLVTLEQWTEAMPVRTAARRSAVLVRLAYP